MSPEEAELHKDMDTADVEQRRLDTEIPTLKRKIADYQQRVAATPAHEQQFAALTRDYNVLDVDYQKLKNKKLEAQISQNLEQRQEGERFQVLDPANLPLAPEAPNRKALALMGIFFSLSLAAALPFALYFTDTSFKDPNELRRVLELGVAATIPELPELEDNHRRALFRSLAISSACFCAGVGMLFLYARGF